MAEEAGVSRPTVYRWFPTKTLLLAAITAYEVEQFDTGLQALADQYDDPSERFDASLRYMVTYLDETIGADAISADPAFSLQSLADSLGPHIRSVAGVLGDASIRPRSGVPARSTREQGAEMLLRVAVLALPRAQPRPRSAALDRARVFAGVTGTPARVRRRPVR